MFTTKDTKSTKIWMTEGLVVGLVFERMRLEVGYRKRGRVWCYVVVARSLT